MVLVCFLQDYPIWEPWMLMEHEHVTIMQIHFFLQYM